MISGIVMNPLTTPQSYRWPSISPKITPSKPAVASATPRRSSRCLRPGRRSGISSMASANVTTPIGMFTVKIERQPKWVTRRPPTVGPATTARPAITP